MQFLVLFQKWGGEKFTFSILRCREQGIKTTLEKYRISEKKGDRKGVGEKFVKQQVFAESKNRKGAKTKR